MWSVGCPALVSGSSPAVLTGRKMLPAPSTLVHTNKAWIPSVGAYLLALAGLLGCLLGRSPSTFVKVERCGEIQPRPLASERPKGKEGLARKGSERRGLSEISPSAGASSACSEVRWTNLFVSSTARGEQVQGCRMLLLRLARGEVLL